jgi:uncharacterized protein DUF3995
MSDGATRTGQWTVWAGYAAAIWSLLFAAVSFYWAAGGAAGADTIGPAIAQMAVARDPGFITVLWATGALKAAGVLVALALTLSWGGIFPRWLLLVAGWAGCVFLTLYGAASTLQHGLMLASVQRVPAGLGITAARWHLLLWDPWWVVGGILFGLTVWGYQQRSRVT